MSRTVLLVDDEFWALKSMEMMFPWEKYGFRIIGKCTDSKDALSIMLNLCPDVVMTDVRMPDIGGTDLLRRAREEGMDSVFVLVSAVSDFEAARLGMHYGAVEYCLKPLDADEGEKLLQRIARLLPESTEAKPADDGVVSAICDYIDANLHTKLTVPAVAEQFHMSPNFLMRLFCTEKGTTFRRYLEERRMEIAKRLLMNRRLTISEIAERTGYSDQNYFAYCFRRCFGISPNKYRSGGTERQEKGEEPS